MCDRMRWKIYRGTAGVRRMSVPSESLCSQYRGSLRAGSYNRAALRTAIELKPPAMTIETADILAFPLYNEDVGAQGFPPPVATMSPQIGVADAPLFVNPGGVLKNAIDWASPPARLALRRQAGRLKARGCRPDQDRRRRARPSRHPGQRSLPGTRRHADDPFAQSPAEPGRPGERRPPLSVGDPDRPLRHTRRDRQHRSVPVIRPRLGDRRCPRAHAPLLAARRPRRCRAKRAV